MKTQNPCQDTTAPSPIGREAILFAVLFVVCSFVPAAQPVAAASGKEFLTLEEALKLAFGDAKVERGTIYLDEGQVKRIEERAGSAPYVHTVHPYSAFRDGRRIGTAYLDTHVVRTMKETVMVVVDDKDCVQRVELLAFGEPKNYVPKSAWYGQFTGRKLDAELSLKRSIRGVTGATLTTTATTAAVRRVLALHEVLNKRPDSR